MARINKVGMRADKFVITGIKNMRRGDGTYIMEGRSRLVKEVDHFSMTCPECGEVGRHDEDGDIVCDDPTCAVLLSGDTTPPMYPEDYSARRSDMGNGGTGNRSVSASGHPLLRVPALRDAGPSADDGL